MMGSLALRGVVLAVGLGSAVAVGCYTGPGVDTNRIPDPSVAVNGVDPAQRDGGGQPNATAQTPRGVPCDIASVLATNCIECHGAVPAGGAQNRILTYEDLAGPPSDPGFKTVAEYSLSRMKSTTRPMPPTAQIDSESVNVFERWVGKGLPRGTCGETPADGGTSVGDPDGGATPSGPTWQCTSNVREPYEKTSEFMRPGRACIDCHSQVADPQPPPFDIAGTVYPTVHEPSDCRGAENATVVIIDAKGVVHELQTNAAGNFMLDTPEKGDPLPMPYRAVVSWQGNLREMLTPQTNGDCNSCHTESGIGPLGRIYLK
jgi:hypothetical protein